MSLGGTRTGYEWDTLAGATCPLGTRYGFQKLVMRVVFSRVISNKGRIDWSASELHELFQLFLSQEAEVVT